jgi:hypothetical protein
MRHVAKAARRAALPENTDMNAVPELTGATRVAAPAATALAPRIKLTPQAFSIDHPNPDLGERLMANALGAVDGDAMDGLLQQLIKASTNGGKPDERSLSFMISMVKSIRQRDSVEAMLVAQMVSIHVMAMRSAYHLANAEDLAQFEGAGRVLGRLARTFPAQIEALNRYRSSSEPAISVRTVSVGDGGHAIVGNVTQHASMILPGKRPAAAARTVHRRRPAAHKGDARHRAGQAQA